MIWLYIGVGGAVLTMMIAFGIYSNQVYQIRCQRVEDEGERVMGWLVMANTVFFQKGTSDSYGLAVFTLDHGLQDDEDFEEILERWAIEAGQFRERDARNANESKIAAIIASQAVFDGHLKLPRSITGDDKGYLTCVKILRSLLPRGKLTDNRIFLKVLLGDDGGTIMVKYPRE